MAFDKQHDKDFEFSTGNKMLEMLASGRVIAIKTPPWKCFKCKAAMCDFHWDDDEQGFEVTCPKCGHKVQSS
tara:strand:+ start:724 stop:939 length:216 start_codon:yes stop_codon:yes gene_type:complete